MKYSKSKNLFELSKIVDVPSFIVLNKNDKIPKLDNNFKYMVRCSRFDEDQVKNSFAGLSTTIGPIKVKKVNKAVNYIFKKENDCEVIIQKFLEGINGVAFCFSKKNIYLEYSSLFAGVTSGKIKPFVAILPTDMCKYKNLQKELMLIFKKFGPCDVEFINLEKPRFVQVRPITKQFKTNNDLKILMKIQELGFNWIENDFCKIIPERTKNQNFFMYLYLKSLSGFYKKFLNKSIKIFHPAFIKIGSQFFFNESIQNQMKLSFSSIIRLVFYWIKNKEDIKKKMSNDLIKSIEVSIMLSLLYEFFKTNELILLREKYRKHIDSLLNNQKKVTVNYKINHIKCNRKINSIIQLNKEKNIWMSNLFVDSKGVIIIPGKFTGPYQYIKSEKEIVKKNHTIISTQLFPNIGENIDHVKGIICEGGSLMSHVCILARERKIPLIIQADNITKSENIENYINDIKK